MSHTEGDASSGNEVVAFQNTTFESTIWPTEMECSTWVKAKLRYALIDWFVPSSILTQKIPLTEEPGRLESMASQRVRCDSAYAPAE